VDKINSVGAQIVGYILVAGYWITFISGLSRCIMKIKAGDTKGAWSEILGHIIAYAALYAMKAGLDMVKGMF
jgi:hypothetical protein